MAINNNPLRQTTSAFHKMNEVVKTAAEAVVDQVHDFDGDQTGLAEVKAEVNKMSAGEKAALSVGALATGGALPLVSLIVEEAVDLTKKGAKEIGHAVNGIKEAAKEKYSNPPEKPLADKLEKGLKKAGNAIEEKVDDLKDGRVGRDLKKSVSRGFRDNFTHQTPAEKLGNAIKDTFEDAGDAIEDFVDDVKDGRLQKKIKQAFED
ncbi:hypothetical protein COW36_12035 [bacterium (Candidatus Blackallbacteria) CG17_big_fil_post_rev_8_21_14_2_50_48_46]|uniref:Uncharacterized protein n=1 Tax=bacterium (Candidatus Blackallbacteria) CG17_big_fil_post_rev_8_21_14_2_50_48_46 TaxID=2014261 RepID=A0A2M7G3P9_9BACT|nr:MAG: hypothetical protein COW64_03225 [bacterium (Candidatus Blackallbacteria) CG18_big_fil_WC_8_21_14_2_50_49_26]PIW16489.1 MAG: hypothetical protein COW36_12035 [bacterium (Candidatus Blackallbacteria) CG17_big_fil_post_rev_8_21_14_2_50_48_46]PIW45997.1 MAG: hypothetical protein COW20_17300 [bacterium (Candidatus Blackallbacteria) CG13_big_fil_rev_8_21_14_2_50_49_14]